MRVVFMGTPDFAVPSLSALAAEHDVIAVYTRPDAVSGRGSATRPSPVKVEAERLGVEVRQPATLRDPDELAHLDSLAPDIVCVAAYGLILPVRALESARLGAVNVHASLLPRWRGAAPIQRAILAGDTSAGVSIMRMEAGLDTGPYCSQVSTPVAEKTASALTAELAALGASALVAALPQIASDTAVWVDQDEALVTYAEKVSKADVAPAPDLKARDNALRIRASLPAAPARALVAGKGVTLLDAVPTGDALAPGAIRADRGGIALGCVDGAILVTRVKPDGRAEMDAAAWARGVRDIASASWEALR